MTVAEIKIQIYKSVLSNNVHVKQQSKHKTHKYILHEYLITQNTAIIKDKLKHESKSFLWAHTTTTTTTTIKV